MKEYEFLNKWCGKKCDFDNAFGAQCVDLFRQYCHEVYEIEHTGSVNGAKELYSRYDDLPKEQKYFERVENFKDFKPFQWVVFTNTQYNPYGHVALIVSITDDNMLVFEQNGFSQDGAKFATRNKNNVLGALKFKGKNNV